MKTSKSMKSKNIFLYLNYFSDVDDFNKSRKDFLHFLINNLNCNPYLMGWGAPMRTPSYLFGYKPKYNNYDDNDRNKYKKKNYNRDD